MATARNYLVVTAAYWGFTLTDGALRMLVLLHFYSLGYTPFQLAFLFLLYELAGRVRQCGRRMACGPVWHQADARRRPAAADRRACSCCPRCNQTGVPTFSVAWVVIAQGVAGVAKDVTKTASKSAIKATSDGGAGQLYRWVAWFTGSKNAMKGVGFFVGGLLLQTIGFRPSLWLMAAVLAVIFLSVAVALPPLFGRAKASRSMRELFAKNRAINLLAVARIFMFGARDVWFVVGLPVFLYAHGWHYMEVAGFVAAWTIGYGGIQAVAPMLTTRSPDGLSREIPAARVWGLVMALLPALLAVALVEPCPGPARPSPGCWARAFRHSVCR